MTSSPRPPPAFLAAPALTRHPQHPARVPTTIPTQPLLRPYPCPASSRRASLRASLPTDASTDTDTDTDADTSTNPPSETSAIPPADSRDLKSDIITTLAWVLAASGVAVAMNFLKSPQAALQFVTAYIVEYSLSVDNLFVFLLIFSYFQVPRTSQTRVLSLGIAGAILFRGIMIVAGEALTRRFEFVTVFFALILLFSAFKLVFSSDEDEQDVSQSPIVKFASGLLPFTDKFDGDRFFTTVDGASLATPLMLVLLSVEFSDVVFALDSVPAVLGISKDASVIYLSNIMAIAGLRSLFFVLSDSIGDLRFLPQALATVLGFVGAKMLAGVAGYEVPILPSLSVIVGALSLGVGLSVLFPEPPSSDE